jgi:Asp-tRNA(Asn)/Glu-tRNA(Gln) amidotransferase A subunit family amidase
MKRAQPSAPSATRVVEGCLQQAARNESWLHAYAWLDPERARRLAREADAAPSRGPLAGMAIGVKDIIDTAGIPTECGTPLLAGRVPKRSAALVERIERAGGIVIGKTVTSELAYYHPGPTVNPYDPSRTPGGSSMGSAAALAPHILEATGAVGSQTNGSVIRPAAFCGVVGFKPTYGRIPVDGVLEFARSLDTIGAFGPTVEVAARIAAVMAGDDPSAWIAPRPRLPRFAIARTGDWERADAAARERFDADCEALAEHAALVDLPQPLEGLDDAVPLLRVIMSVEGARAIGPIVDRDPAQASREIRALIDEGRSTPESRYREALERRRALQSAYAAWADGFEAVLTLPAAGEAPPKDTTGDPRFCTRWTFLGAPAVTIPTGRGPHGLPLGLQLVGVAGADARLLAAARWAESALASGTPGISAASPLAYP